MERIETMSELPSGTWFTRRCRQWIFSALEKLDCGSIEILEGTKKYRFGKTEPDSSTAQIVVFDATFYADVIKGGSIGAGEAYIAHKWHSPNLTKLIELFAKAQQLLDRVENKKSLLNQLKYAIFHRLNDNSRQGSKKNILSHYDLGNELYTRFLDPQMMYSAAIYPDENASLAEAQLHKLDMICQRLDLQAGETLLEIGTGWGGLAIYAAQHYGVKVTTTTISDAQYAYAQQRIKSLGLEQQITLLKQDYRELTGQFDKVVSIEMIEAVGHRYMNSFVQQCNDRLKQGGKILIQAITIADQRFDYYLRNVDFIQRYIFPGGFLPSISFISEKLRDNSHLVIEEMHDIGLDYAKTLAHWRENFLDNWSELTNHGFDDKFKRLWLFYLGYCEGAFLARATSTIQLIARK